MSRTWTGSVVVATLAGKDLAQTSRQSESCGSAKVAARLSERRRRVVLAVPETELLAAVGSQEEVRVPGVQRSPVRAAQLHGHPPPGVRVADGDGTLRVLVPGREEEGDEVRLRQ
jgi:hypothetical protein